MNLDVRLDGFDQPIGHLASDDRGAVSFAYAEMHLQREDALAPLPVTSLTSGDFGDVATRAYFDNLLQERDTARADIIAKYGLTNDDIVGILYHLGKDCSGAVSVLPEGAPAAKVPGDLSRDYVAYSNAQLADVVSSLYERRPLPADAQDPSPLAGVQSKIAVTMLPDGRLAEPRDGAPTTHILKVPQQRHEGDARREHMAMELSRDVGAATATTALIEAAGIPALLIERFDRRITDGLVTRIHQEDFCQALGLPARLKYERYGREGSRFDAQAIRRVLERTVRPAAERLKFVEATLFDILIGNVDGHAKNFSLFHLPGSRIMTTPRYDVMPTMLDRATTDEFAYRLGHATNLEEADSAALDIFLDDLGFSSAAGRRRILDNVLASTIEALNGRIDMIGTVDKNFGDLIGTNIRTLCRNLGRPAPYPAEDRDAFVR